MDPWTVAATLFAAGAFGIGVWEQVRRWRNRPTRSWSLVTFTHRNDPAKMMVDLQLIGDAPAYHVTVEGVGVDLSRSHHDHERGRTEWPHEGMVEPSHEPMRLYLEETGDVDDPHLLVCWLVPPVRRWRFFEQRIPVREAAPLGPEPYELKAPPCWKRVWRRVRRR